MFWTLLFIGFAVLPYIISLMVSNIRNTREKNRQQNWIFLGSLPKVSLLIAFRNEHQRIRPLLESLASLDYPEEKLEIIMVDDHSEDQTAQVIRDFAKERSMNISLFDLPQGKAGKKAAMVLAREKATSDDLFFTDADVQLPTGWIRKMLSCQQNSGAEMVCSEVEVVFRKGLLNIFESLEQASLVALSAASVASENVFLCNGAGYLVKKQVLSKMVMPEAWLQSPGGDDVMLLHAMHKAGYKIAYCRLDASRVMLEPIRAEEFLQQRIRWGSKVFLGNSSGNFVQALLVWIFHSLNVWLFGSIIWGSGIYAVLFCFLAGFFLRGLWEATLVHDFISPGIQQASIFQNHWKGNFSGKTYPMAIAGMFSLLAPVYSLYIMLAGPLLFFIRSFSWKGRTYSSRKSPPTF